MLIHQVKNKLTNQITLEIAELLKRNHFNTTVAKTLTDIKNSSLNIVKTFSTYLNNLGLKLSQTEIPQISFADLSGIVNAIQSSQKIRIIVNTDSNSQRAVIKVNKDILQAIFEQLVDNAGMFYSKNDLTIDKESININWKANKQDNIVEISVTSSNTSMDDETLNNYGINPIRDTGSTGLGGLFINSILEQIGAIKFNDERYFKPTNEENGFCLLIKFNLHNVKNGN